MVFPQDFLWGAATSSTQIEGGWNEDGRTPSIWDVAPEDKITGGADCHVACDHYHRWREDVALMKELGLKSYRFSISWSRIMPEEGKINARGVAFYSDLIDELRNNGIEPLVTIYHWDLPVWVQEKGGWLSKKIVPLFADYTKAVVDSLSDRVTCWIPLNEPQCFIMNGHMTGAHAPFIKRYLALSRLTRNAYHVTVLDDRLQTIVRHPRLYGKNKESMIWGPYLDVLAQRPTALKYSGFFQSLTEPVRQFLGDCDLDSKKRVLKAVAQACREDGLNRSVNALSDAVRLAPKDADALISAYAFVLNKPGQIPKNDVPDYAPELKEYTLDFTPYAKLMGGAACSSK